MNLLNINLCVMGVNNATVNSAVTYTSKTNRACTKYDVNPISCKPSTSYTVKFNSFYFSVAQLDNNNIVLSDSGWKSSDFTFTTNASASKIVMNFKKSNDSNFTIDDFKTANIKLEEGSKASGYSSYGMGSITEKIVNKNWFKFELEDGQILNKDGSLTVTVTSAKNVVSLTLTEKIPAGIYTFKNISNVDWVRVGENTSAVNINDGQSYTFEYDGISVLRIASSTQHPSDGAKTYKAQLEKGSIATAYVSHQEQTYTIPTQQPMRSIGNVRDLFFKNTPDSPYYNSSLVENKWYEMHNIEKYVLTGNESWVLNSNIKSFVVDNFSIGQVKGIYLSNCFRIKSAYDRQEVGIYWGSNLIITTAGSLAETETLANFKTWLGSNNVQLIYKLATPTYLPCTAEQEEALEAYSKARTYKNVTHLYSEDEVPGYVDMTYYKDLETYLGNEIGNVKQAIVALGGVI